MFLQILSISSLIQAGPIQAKEIEIQEKQSY